MSIELSAPSQQPIHKGYVDPFGRTIDYVRLSVTDRCDLRCFYCMPKGYKDFEEPAHWLNFDEITQIMRAFAGLGINRVRITGGEPLVRKNIPQLVEQLTGIESLNDISLSTNGVKLAKQASALFDAGVSRLNVSLDTIDPDAFAQITGGGKLQKVIDGLLAAKAAGFSPIKINMVMMQGINDDKLFDMLEFCAEHGFTLRMIETMPMGTTGQNATNHYIDLADIKQRIEQRYQLVPAVEKGAGPARYLAIPEVKPGKGLKIGFITPISQHFCGTCNRVRLGVDGTLYLCLGQEHQYPLGEIVKSGASTEELQQHLIKALALKPERHEFTEKPDQIIRIMSATGG